MNKFDKKITVTACILAATTIAIGAFGAHGLKELIDAEAQGTFETGVRYQMYHSIALLIIGFAMGISEKTRRWVFWFFLLGVILFSGSIYILAFKDLIPVNVAFLGPITPIGGILFIVGWLRLAYGVLTNK